MARATLCHTLATPLPVDIGLSYQLITTGCGGECNIKPYQSSLGCPSRISPGTTLIPNDVAMVPISQDSILNLFADDVLLRLYKIISTIEDYTATQGDINVIADWSDNNYLVLNCTKCKSMIISRKRKLSRATPQLFLNNCLLDQVDTFKYLGILLSCDVSWSPHIATVCSKARQVIGLLYRRFYPVADTHTLICLYIYLFSSTTPGTRMSTVVTLYP